MLKEINIKTVPEPIKINDRFLVREFLSRVLVEVGVEDGEFKLFSEVIS